MAKAARPPIAPTDEAAPGAAAALDEAQGKPAMEQKLSTDKLPIDQLAHMDYDQTVFFLSTGPLLTAITILIVFVTLVYYRRAKQWNEIGPAMRLDDEAEAPLAQSQFATAELAELDQHLTSKNFNEKS